MSGKVPLRLFQVDAFTAVPFKGNPAAVLLLNRDTETVMSDAQRQNIAAELNLSETSFVELLDADTTFQNANKFKLRWFTPKDEARLCGHATLAAAAAIIRGTGNSNSALHFYTVHSGELVVRCGASKLKFEFEMDLPNERPIASIPEWAHQASPLVKAFLGDSSHKLQEIKLSGRLQYLLLVLDDTCSREQLEALQPDFLSALTCVSHKECVMVIISVKADLGSGYDFVSRAFAPWSGINEDPVTGSAHAVLGPYWADRLGKDRLQARQCSPRGGDIGLEVKGETVRIHGDAVIVSQGELLINFN